MGLPDNPKYSCHSDRLGFTLRWALTVILTHFINHSSSWQLALTSPRGCSDIYIWYTTKQCEWWIQIIKSFKVTSDGPCECGLESSAEASPRYSGILRKLLFLGERPVLNSPCRVFSHLAWETPLCSILKRLQVRIKREFPNAVKSLSLSGAFPRPHNEQTVTSHRRHYVIYVND